MTLAKILLAVGLMLSLFSKVLQWRFSSLWGDLIILPAAMCMVVGLLLLLPNFQHVLKQPSTKGPAKTLLFLVCLTVLTFQLFTMLTFERGHLWSYEFLLPFLILLASTLYLILKLFKFKKN